MRSLLLIQFLSWVACATLPDRYVASESNPIIGKIDTSESSVSLLPLKIDNHETALAFYLQFKRHGKFIDVKPEEIVLKNKNKIIETKIYRIAQGRYELNALREIANISSLQFFVQNKKIKHSLKAIGKPSRLHTKIFIIANDKHVLSLRLEIGDKKGIGVKVVPKPELILEGIGQFIDLKPIGSNIWEFSLEYPEENQVLYFSVRANGVLLERIFRYQHIEK